MQFGTIVGLIAKLLLQKMDFHPIKNGRAQNFFIIFTVKIRVEIPTMKCVNKHSIKNPAFFAPFQISLPSVFQIQLCSKSYKSLKNWEN